MATPLEIESIKRKLRKEAAKEALNGPNWKELAKKSAKGLRKSQKDKKKTDAMSKRLPGGGWSG